MSPSSIYTPTQTPTAPPHGLEEFLADYVAPVGDALRRAIEGLPRRCASSGELAQLLGLDQSSVWRIWHAAYANDPEECVLMLSGEAAIQRFVNAMASRGMDAALGTSVLHQLRRFVAAVEAEIGDMSTLRLMLAGRDGHLGADSRFGRLLHDAHRLRLGIECAATLRTHVRVLSPFDGLVDVLTVNQLVGLRTLRTSPAIVAVRRILEAKRPTDKLHAVAFTQEPLCTSNEPTPTGLPEGVSAVNLVAEASHANGRRLYDRAIDASSIYTCVDGGKTGKRGESTLAFGDVIRAYGPTFEHANYWGTGTEVCVPSELLVYELYITDAEYRAGLKPTPRLYQMLYSPQPGWGTRLDSDLSGELEHYPPGRPRPQPSELPGYGAIANVLHRRAGVSMDTLHLFRWRVSMPVVAVRYLLYAERARANNALVESR